jgi:hypothetical protein
MAGLEALIGRGWILRAGGGGVEYEKGVRWMPWRQEAMKDVARCDKPRGDASDR